MTGLLRHSDLAAGQPRYQSARYSLYNLARLIQDTPPAVKRLITPFTPARPDVARSRGAALQVMAWLVCMAVLMAPDVTVAQVEDTSDNAERDDTASEVETSPDGEDDASNEYPETDEPVTDDTVSGSIDDSTSSIEAVREPVAAVARDRWLWTGDARAGYVREELEDREGQLATVSAWRARARLGARRNLIDWLLFDARVAVQCASDECDLGLALDPSETNPTSIESGDIAIDQMYFHIYRRERFDAAFGRMQVKFTTRAGVFAKSLDRNNSNAFNINWTDGLHGAYHFANESILHVIAEYNDPDGVSNVRRNPLDFSDSDARVSYYVGWESLERSGPFTQRGIGITYLPSALMKDGIQTGPIEDYLGVVARFATNFAWGDGGRRWNIAGELGYAPQTPTRSAMNLAGTGDAGGLAWAVYASLMDIWPNHSVGLNISHTDPGWLISPQYRANGELIELRYLWRKQRNLAFEFRVRHRQDSETLAGLANRDETDFFARFTIGMGR